MTRFRCSFHVFVISWVKNLSLPHIFIVFRNKLRSLPNIWIGLGLCCRCLDCIGLFNMLWFEYFCLLLWLERLYVRIAGFFLRTLQLYLGLCCLFFVFLSSFLFLFSFQRISLLSSLPLCKFFLLSTSTFSPLSFFLLTLGLSRLLLYRHFRRLIDLWLLLGCW